MLRCREVAERASLLIDGELGPLQRLNMRLHLAMCRGCKAFVEQLRITQDLTKKAAELGSEDIGEGVSAVLSRMRSGPGSPR